MKPVKLTMSGFCSYADKVTIDFDKLGKTGVFLICGSTGSGKTTIFDAIAFALYGEPSGNIRSPKLLRSKLASPETPTYVTLEFTIGEKAYRITRNPEYPRRSKRGDGTTIEKPNAELILPDGSMICGKDNVTLKIRELLGLDREQFSQIAMIAQGDFREMLLADTSKRSELLRKLFKTENYERLQERLKSAASEKKAAYDALLEKLGRFSVGVTLPSGLDSDHVKLIEAAANGTPTDPQMLVEALEWLASFFKQKLSGAESELNVKEKLLSNSKRALERAEELIESFSNYKSALNESIRSHEAAEAARALLNKPENSAKRIDDAKAELAELNAHIEDYVRHDSLKIETAELNNKMSEVSCEYNQLMLNLESDKAALEARKDLPLRISSLTEMQSRAQVTLEKLNDSKSRIEKMIVKQSELRNIRDEYSKLCNDFSNKLALHAQKVSFSSKCEQIFMMNQAGILAHSLINGIPCPVCGSTEHPSPAKADNLMDFDGKTIEIDESTFKNAKDEAEKASIQMQKASEMANSKKSELQIKLEHFNNSCQDYFGKTADFSESDATLNDELSRLELEIHKHDEIIRTSTDEITQIKELADALPSIEKSIKESEETAVRLREILTQTHALLESKNQELDSINLKYENLASAKKAAQEIESDITALTNKRNSLENSERTSALASSAANAKLAELKQRIAGKEIPDTDQLERETYEIEAARNKARTVRDRIAAESEKVKLAYKNAEKALTDIRKAEIEYIDIKSISDTANGMISGKTKLKLEAFVQASYLDRVLAAANIRLLKMTGARYELVRTKEANDNSSQSGLELNVHDHYCACERSVKTLSGGETFMASLSLALGMADIIEREASGIRIDSMFIDEGFGSLDPEALASALSVITELCGSSRSVGIISHVGELRAKIDRKILVKRTPDGKSSATIEI